MASLLNRLHSHLDEDPLELGKVAGPRRADAADRHAKLLGDGLVSGWTGIREKGGQQPLASAAQAAERSPNEVLLLPPEGLLVRRRTGAEMIPAQRRIS